METTGTDEAVAAKGPPLPLLSQPSTWSAVWAALALIILAALRGTLAKLT